MAHALIRMIKTRNCWEKKQFETQEEYGHLWQWEKEDNPAEACKWTSSPQNLEKTDAYPLNHPDGDALLVLAS